MKKQSGIRMDNRCSEPWDQMTPIEGGMYCDACEKTVLDLTSLSDIEVSKIFAKHGNNLCARVRPDQLHRPLQVPRKDSWLFKVTAAAFAAVASLGAYGQEAVTSEASPTEQNETDPNASPERKLPLKELVFNARVVESKTRIAIPQAQWHIVEIARKGLTDFDGIINWSEVLPDAHWVYTIEIIAFGYEKLTVVLNAEEMREDLVLEMEEWRVTRISAIAGGISYTPRTTWNDVSSLLRGK